MCADNTQLQYPNIFGCWDSRASVRVTPRRKVSELRGKTVFPRSLVPVCAHKLILKEAPEATDQILARRLYSYLDTTVILEQGVINPTLLQIAWNRLGLDFPAQMRFDAYRIYCDEAYHALFSVDLEQQVSELTGVSPIAFPEPNFMRCLRESIQVVPSDLRDLASLCFSIVSETLISGALSTIPEDPTVLDIVRQVVSDHARDERRHHAYFSKVFEIAWPQFGIHERHILGPLFARHIIAFLEPDTQMLQRIVGQYVNDEQAAEVITESHTRRGVMEDIQRASRATMSILARGGVFDDPMIADSFERAGLVPTAQWREGGSIAT